MNCLQSNNGISTENLVFLNKIFYDNTGASCPVIFPLETDTENYTQQLIIGGTSGGCGCGNGCSCGCGTSSSCDFDLCNAQFTVTNSCVTVTSAVLAETSTFAAENITVDGFPVTSLTLQNGRYVADLSSIMADLTNCPCAVSDRHLCRSSCSRADSSCSDCIQECENDGHFFLAEVPGPWELMLSIVLEGYVSNGRCTRDFRLCIRTRSDATGQFPVTVDANNNFALYCVDIPCQSQGISPALRFNFEACAMLLNPVLTVLPAETPAGNCPAPLQFALAANMVFTPKINLQVVRPSLFALNATEVAACCDDMGQCDPCAPYENGGSSCGQPVSQLSACQCCDTNGYGYGY